MIQECVAVVIVMLCAIGLSYAIKHTSCDALLEQQKAAIREELHAIRLRDKLVAGDIAEVVAGRSAQSEPVR
jgi:hypothetical protein